MSVEKPASMMTISEQCQEAAEKNGQAVSMPPTPTKTNTERMPVPKLRIMPIAAFFMAFATVMTVLTLYIDNTARKHYQFRVNMSRDYEMFGVSQDNPQLIAYIRQVHLRSAIETHHKPLESLDILSNDTGYVLKLLSNKQNGVFVEAGAYNDGKFSRTEYLEKHLNWKGLLIQSDPRHYFNLRRHNRKNSQAVHACLSPTPYPREITMHQHQDRDDVKVRSVHVNSLDDPDWLVTRVKCFPLYSLLLAMNTTSIDYFSLESDGNELAVLETIPFDRVKISVVGVHLVADDSERTTIKKFLTKKKYKFMQNFNTTFVFKLNQPDM